MVRARRKSASDLSFFAISCAQMLPEFILNIVIANGVMAFFAAFIWLSDW
jgi:hypothetical protein